jgi:CheY-specific phosphatase CheX
MSKIAADGAHPVSAEVRDQLLEPFATATRTALGEMASADVAVRSMSQNPGDHRPGDIAIVVRLASATLAFLVLSFPQRTAAALAGRMLAGVSAVVDEPLVRECVGEIGNVVAGQAKALLAGTPYQFVFSLPEVIIGVSDDQPAPGLDCLVIDFMGDPGEFALRLFVKLQGQ